MAAHSIYVVPTLGIKGVSEYLTCASV